MGTITNMEGETYKERRNIKREQTMEGRVVKWNGETTTWKEGNMKRGTNKGRKGGPKKVQLGEQIDSHKKEGRTKTELGEIKWKAGRVDCGKIKWRKG